MWFLGLLHSPKKAKYFGYHCISLYFHCTREYHSITVSSLHHHRNRIPLLLYLTVFSLYQRVSLHYCIISSLPPSLYLPIIFTLARSRSPGFIRAPWKYLTWVCLLLRRPSNSRSGSALENRNKVKPFISLPLPLPPGGAAVCQMHPKLCTRGFSQTGINVGKCKETVAQTLDNRQ